MKIIEYIKKDFEFDGKFKMSDDYSAMTELGQEKYKLAMRKTLKRAKLYYQSQRAHYHIDFLVREQNVFDVPKDWQL